MSLRWERHYIDFDFDIKRMKNNIEKDKMAGKAINNIPNPGVFLPVLGL